MIATNVSYAQTNAFSALVTNYLAQNPNLQPFYAHPVNLQGIQNAITQRNAYQTNRTALVNALQAQYYNVALTNLQQQNLTALLQPNTYTVTTAHQPNLFTGPLYFMYKILHAVKLANYLKQQLPQHNFVPVYYIGSEDADVEELNHFTIDGKTYTWQTQQTGAFGRMLVDAELVKIINQLNGQLAVTPHGAQVVALLAQHFSIGTTIATATFNFVNSLTANLGLIIVQPDNAALKKLFIPVIEKELTENFSEKIVQQTVAQLAQHFKVQASTRPINLFYLANGIRNRIEQQQNTFVVVNTNITFTQQTILIEVQNHPERFSPNVILRPVYQETILPNIAFIGGGGELAYWLELKEVFNQVHVPYPVLVLRNSYLLANQKQLQSFTSMGFSIPQLFTPTQNLINLYVAKHTTDAWQITQQKQQIEALYNQLIQSATNIDVTLTRHTKALQIKALHKLEVLEKKMFKAAKRKFAEQQNQINTIRQQLFPNNNLQERHESMLGFYAKHGPNFLQCIYDNALPLQQQFCVLSI
jgi:bacillithiol synthase